MQISRRATLAYASALTAVSATSARATVGPQAESIGRSQLVQHLVVHPDEAGGRIVCAYLSLPAPDTAWRTSTTLDETALHEANGTWHRRGYGVRRISAFQTRDGVRYAAIWQLGRTVPAHVQTGMDLAT